LVADKVLLEDVSGPEQLNEYYEQEGLVGTVEKINHLVAKTGVMATRSSGTISNDTMLSVLEESVYLGHWRYFGRRVK
jgi:hypothetical protein